MLQSTFSSTAISDHSFATRLRLFRAILWAAIGSAVVYSVVLWLFGNTTGYGLLYVLTPIPVSSSLLILLRYGYVRFAALAFTVLAWLIMFFGAVIAGGVEAPAYSGFILPILIAGWLLGKRAGIFFAFLSSLAGVILIISYGNGWLEPIVRNTFFSIWISQLFFFFIAAAILYVSIDNSDKIVERVKKSEKAALETNDKLRAEVDARKIAEQELQFQADVLSQVQDAVIVTNTKREIIYWNQGAEKLYGTPSEQILNQSVFSVFQYDHADNPQADERMEALATTGVWQGNETAIVRTTGKKVATEAIIKFVNDERSTLSHIIISARDIRERLKTENALQYRTEAQQLVTKLATRFINLPVAEIDQGIVDALQLLCDFFDMSRGVIALFSEDLQTLHYENQYYDKNSSFPLELDTMPTSKIPWSMERLKRFEPVSMPSVADLPQEASIDKATFQAFWSHSFIGIPLMQNKKLVGLLGSSSSDKKDGWPEDMINQLYVLGQVIVNLLERRTVEENLRIRDAELNATANQLATLLDIDRTIFSAQTLQDVTELTLRRLFDLFRCQYNSIFLINEAGDAGYYIAQYPTEKYSSFSKFIPLVEIIELDDLRNGIISLNGDFEHTKRDAVESAFLPDSGVSALARVPLKSSGHLIGILYMGFEKNDVFAQVDVELLEGIATSLALAIANTQLYERVQSHADELEDKIEVATADLMNQYNLQAALAKIELAINKPRELQNVLEQIVTIVTDSLNIDKGASIILWNTEAETFTISATTVFDQKSPATAQCVRKRGGATRWIIDHGELLIVADTSTDPFGPNNMIRENGIGAYAGVPLLNEGRAIGVLYILNSVPRSFAEEQINFLQMVAHRATLAITKVRLFERTRELAMEEERRRLARDLHDAVSQSLFSATMIAESLPLLFDRNPDMAKQELKNLHGLTQGAANEMRTLLFELRPTALTENTLSDLLKQLCNAFAARTHIPLSTNIDMDIRFPPRLQLGIYRIAQEALNNVTKYARARNLWVEMTCQDDEFRLVIRDDGRGFDPNKIPADHVGLQIMSERAKEIDAILEIDTALGIGTKISLYRRLGEHTNNGNKRKYDKNFAR